MRYKKEIIPALVRKKNILMSKMCDGLKVYEDVEFKVTGNRTKDAFEIIGNTEKNQRYESWVMLPKMKDISLKKETVTLNYGRVTLIIK